MVAPPHKLLVNTVCNASTVVTAYTAYTASTYTVCAAFCLHFYIVVDMPIYTASWIGRFKNTASVALC